MNIAVVVRQVPDLIETLEIDASGAALDWDAASFIINECDDHALEQALLAGGRWLRLRASVGAIKRL